MQIQAEFVYPAAASVCASISAVFDVRSRRVPNFITGPAIIAGLALHLILGGWYGLSLSAAAGLVCGLVFLTFYLAGGMGAGDVKLITAAGCLAGMSNSLQLLVWTALAGGAMALFLALLRRQLRQTVLNVGELVNHHRAQGLTPHPDLNIENAGTLRLPYALAIAAGCLVTFCVQLGQR
jgi:prepilin peptidase CpaA